jgi:hypothetical protein
VKRGPLLQRFAAITIVGLLSLTALSFAPAIASQPAAPTSSFTAQVWADNWFSLYVNGKKVGED